jgi:hypothetical protein
VITTSTYLDGAWHNVIVTRKGTTYVLYVDGVSIGSSGGTAPTYGRFYLGASSIYASTNYNGLLDDVRIYSRALTLAEIQTIAAGR